MSIQPPRVQSSPLAARLAQKKQELNNLQQLQNMSADLVGQLEALQEKLSTLADGTEAVAAVMTNWNSVLRAISLASTSLSSYATDKQTDEADGETQEPALPEPLVRIRLDETDNNGN